MEGEAAPAPPRQPRRGPAPIASFDHDYSDESSPEGKQTFRLPEIREHPATAGGGLAVAGEGRARSHSTPGPGALVAPPAPRIDISRASSSSHHDSRDSSPELALFAGDGAEGTHHRLELGFREDGALDLRSSTEELSFLEPAPGEPRPAPLAAPAPAPAPPPPSSERRHSRKDSQSSEAALLGVSGRTSRLSSVGSQCSAVSGVSRVSRLSVVSGASRSPSPHRMLLETSFCGPKPIETDPEACAAAVAEHILEIAKLSVASDPSPSPPALTSTSAPALAIDARDHREIRTEVTVEAARVPPTATPATPTAPRPGPVSPTPAPVPRLPDKSQKEKDNLARGEERKARARVRRQPSEPEVYKSRNKSKDIIRIKLRPDDEDEEEEEEGEPVARKPASLALGAGPDPAPPSPALSRRRSPSPLGPPSVSRKSSFCSLFKSRETIGSPDSPQVQEALRRKRSLTEGRARSKSRDRSATPTSSKIRGSVLSLFRTPRRSAAAASSSPGSRATSPAPAPTAPLDPRHRPKDKLKYYEDANDGVIHIPLRTPPEERDAASGASMHRDSTETSVAVEVPRPASAPQQREMIPAAPSVAPTPRATSIVPASARGAPVQRKVLPDGSIIIPLHSPTERVERAFPEPPRPLVATEPPVEPRPTSRRDDVETTVPTRMNSAATSTSSEVAVSPPSESRPPAPEPVASPPAPPEETKKRRKERLVFTTHVGSREQVFSTQFSITKTPSVTSEISGSFPSFDNGELRDTHITADPPPTAATAEPPALPSGVGGDGSAAVTPQEPPRDSSESEPSSEAAAPQAGNDVERRGLVVQESFEEELPYVPTTLPQERSMAMPMVPVRERGGVLVRGVQRPRAAPTPAPAAPPPPAVAPRVHAGTQPAAADKLRIKLPRRPRVSSASTAPRPSRERTRSGGGGDSCGEKGGAAGKQEWIDFSEVPERRKQPKRIQTLPAGGAGAAEADAAVLFSYVEPDQCRCECHAHTHAHAHANAHPDDTLPLLHDHMHNSTISESSAECAEESRANPPPPPFITDLELRQEPPAPPPPRTAAQGVP